METHPLRPHSACPSGEAGCLAATPQPDSPPRQARWGLRRRAVCRLRCPALFTTSTSEAGSSRTDEQNTRGRAHFRVASLGTSNSRKMPPVPELRQARTSFFASWPCSCRPPCKRQSAEPVPPGFEGATVVEKPNAQVPLDLEFHDEDGKHGAAGRLLQAGPAGAADDGLLPLPDALQPDAQRRGQGAQAAEADAGPGFRDRHRELRPPRGAGTGQGQEGQLPQGTRQARSRRRLAFPRPAASRRPARALGDAIGFGYKLDPKGEQYLHQAAIYICTPDGRVARTIQGVEFDPDVLHDSLINASAGQDQLAGCSAWPCPAACSTSTRPRGKYTWAAMAIMRVMGIADRARPGQR